MVIRKKFCPQKPWWRFVESELSKHSCCLQGQNTLHSKQFQRTSIFNILLSNQVLLLNLTRNSDFVVLLSRSEVECPLFCWIPPPNRSRHPRPTEWQLQKEAHYSLWLCSFWHVGVLRCQIQSLSRWYTARSRAERDWEMRANHSISWLISSYSDWLGMDRWTNNVNPRIQPSDSSA